MAEADKPTVWIVNKSSHNFIEAECWGNIQYLSEGSINRYAVNDMVRKFNDKLANSKESDYLVLCSLSIMNSIACSVFALKHKKLNLLLFKSNKYIERNLVLEDI